MLSKQKQETVDRAVNQIQVLKSDDLEQIVAGEITASIEVHRSSGSGWGGEIRVTTSGW